MLASFPASAFLTLDLGAAFGAPSPTFLLLETAVPRTAVADSAGFLAGFLAAFGAGSGESTSSAEDTGNTLRRPRTALGELSSLASAQPSESVKVALGSSVRDVINKHKVFI
jgi:hypothetical protein